MKSIKFVLKEIYDAKRVSFLLILLPYIFLVLPRIILNPLWSTIEFMGVFIIIVIVDYLLNYLFHINFFRTAAVIFVIAALIFFYFPILINTDFYSTVNLYLRSRTLILIIGCFLLSLYFIFRTEMIKLLNRFLAITSFILLLSYGYDIATDIAFGNTTAIKHRAASGIAAKNKSILLIILDEYHSPLKLYQRTQDKGVLSLKNFLVGNQFYALDSNNSDKTHTLESLNGVFNKNKAVTGIDPFTQLKRTSFITKLYNKGITFHNYGIFDIGNNPSNFHSLHFRRSSSFIGLFFSYTIVNNLTGIDIRNIVYNEVQDTGGYYYYNTQRLKDLNMILTSNLNENHLFYLHLLMPHGPFTITPKFSEEPTLSGYMNYYKFSNNILIKHLQTSNLERFRIIITSDHGFRGDSSLDPHHGATFFKGFAEADLKKIKSIQEIGKLIEDSF